MNKGFTKLISIVLTVCLLLGISGLSPLVGSVAHAASTPTMAETNYGSYQVKLTADPVTDAAPSGFGTADSDGRIWTDKSVTAESDGSFNVKLSALAQEYKTINTTNPGVGGSTNMNGPAADVTFILDMSSSMGSMNGREIAETAGGPGVYYRVEAMAKAANDAIRTVMDANPNNRVAVYWFGGSASNDHLGTFMELGHYEFSSGHGTEDYLKYATSNQTITLNSNLNKDGSSVGSQSAVSLGGGTPTQDGIMYGVSKTMSKVGTKGTGPKRKPYLFLLSDGAAIHAKKAWYTSPKGSSFETEFNNALTDATTIANYNQIGTDGTKYVPAAAGTSLASTGHPEIAALTILTGAYMKDLLDDTYTAYNEGESTQAKVYTVGLGSSTAINGPSGSQPVYAWAGLDPKRVNDNKEDINYNYGSAKKTYDSLVSYAAQRTGGFNYADAFVYSNYYTFAPTYDIVSSAFAGLANDVEATTTILPLLNIPETTDLGSETADIASAIVVSDEISNDFTVDLSTLKIGDAVATVDTSTTISGGTAYKFAGYGSRAVIKTVSGVNSLTWYIDASDMQPHIYRFKNRTNPQSGEYSPPAEGTFKLSYNVKPTFQVPPNNVEEVTRYLNSGNDTDGAKTAAYFFPPTDSPYYDALKSKQTVSKTNGIGASYVSEEWLSDTKATMRLGNNGKLDLLMGIEKKGPATTQTNGSIDYKVTIYNYTDTVKTGLSVASDGQTQTGIDVPANASKELTFTITAPDTPQTVTSGTATLSGIGLVSNTVTTDVTNVTTAVINTHVIGGNGGTTTGDNTYNIGDIATITALPMLGYAFTGWYDNPAGSGNPVSTDAEYDVTVQTDADYYAKFVMMPYAENDSYSVVRGETLTVPASEGILVNDSDGEGLPLTAANVSTLSDPSKGTLTANQDGSFTFVADDEASGTVTFTYRADNGIVKSDVATVTITITLPVATHEPIAENDTYRVKRGETLTVPAETGILSNDSDDENHPLTAERISTLSDPSKGTLTSVDPDGSFTFVADGEASGTVTFTYQAFDGTAYSSVATGTVTITITVPVATHVIGNVGGMTAGDGDYALDEVATLTASSYDGYTFVGWYDNEAGTGTPISTNTTYTFTVTSAGEYYAKFRVLPFAQNDSYRVVRGETLDVPAETGILANDTAPGNGTLTAESISSLSDSSKGTLTVNNDGSLSFVADDGASGSVTFTYRASDETGQSNVATVTITITMPISTHVLGNVGGTTAGDNTYALGESATLTATPATGYAFVGWYDHEEGTGTPVSTNAIYTFNVTSAGEYYAKFSSLPVAENDSYQVVRGGKLTVPVAKGILANDTVVGNNTLTAVSISTISDPSKGTLTVNTDGSFTFEANENASGSVTFTYQASDGVGESNVATVTITFTNPSINGTVMDKKTGDPISGATVILRDLAGKEKGRVTTGSDGKYNFDNVVINKYILEVISHEYSPAHREVSVSTVNGNANGVVTEDFELVEYKITLTANPSSILGNGTATSVFKAVVTDIEGRPQAGVQVVFDVPDTMYGHFAGNSNTVSVSTDAQGVATTTFTAGTLGGTDPISIPLTATVDDSQRGLYASDTIYITFTPGVITGVVTDALGHPIASASITVSKDFDGDGIVDFHAVAVTESDGAYTIAIPKGSETYDVSITKPIEIGGKKTSVTFHQSVPVNANIDGQSYKANKTVSGVVLIGSPQNGTSALNGTVGGGYTISLTDGNGAHTGSIDPNGVFNIDSVLDGSYTADVIYNIPLPEGGTKPVVIGHTKVEISSNGQISISEVLIDPYGTITDSVTGNPIPGAVVKLHYSNGTEVILPPVNGFPPADNTNPQTSDATGQYAYMVFPHTDYYLTATKAGYKDFDSRLVDPSQPLIHVGTEIVLYDFSMTPLSSSSGGGSSIGTPAIPPVVTNPVTPPIGTTQPAEPATGTADSIDLATAILVDKMKVREGDTVTFTVIYANKTLTEADDVYVKANIPAGLSLVDANGGVVTGQELKWTLGKLAGGSQGKLTFKLKVNEMNEGENYAAVTASIGTDDKRTLANIQDDTSLIKVMMYSNRYEHQHDRYIMGYPDGNVKPEKLITRAEIAAIFARTLKLQDEVRHVKLFDDVATDYWGAEYIEAVANKEIFRGYADNTFKPDQPITRAELATAIARYLGVAKELRIDPILRISSFTDIEKNWAEQSIEEVFRFGIVSGYKDGSFQPGGQLTREEAVKMINGMLYRGPLTGVEPSYPDNRQDKWSFGQVEEATRTHTYQINEDGSETMIKYIPEDLW
ncbi:Ig-like domain-containing protein [Paenibacillus xylanexedens]|uniref:Ig-like domain-containing protein n=1 Tax=Paenibacillus xylanexedens TaxID=528191 RepID=UPI0011A7A5DB|nr:Ig-like domain-containing protein [Paenibacillus xylanexedens]